MSRSDRSDTSDEPDREASPITNTEAIDALRPFTSKVPSEALDYVREHWDEAEPVLLAEIEAKLADPLADDDDALFLYAIHLCAEMRCAKAFPLYVRIARLPHVIVDHVMGDILTQSLQHMLARTCDGRIDELKQLIEDPTLYEFTRGAAMSALEILFIENTFSREELSAYCIELLSVLNDQETYRPAKAEETGAFEGVEFVSNWLQDFEILHSAKDCEDYEVEARLTDLNEMKDAMGRPLL